jgi:hypothetical protein
VLGIPLKMLLRANVIADVNIGERILTYQPMNTENKTEEFSILSTVKLRDYFDPWIDFVEVNPKNTLL